MKRTPSEHPPTCLCRGSGWVCEDHPMVPFAAEVPVTCWCEAPGMRCPGQRAARRTARTNSKRAVRPLSITNANHDPERRSA